MTPAVVMRPILLPELSVNQRLPSGPATMSWGMEPTVGVGNSVTMPDGVIRPILPTDSANQRFPSDPSAIPSGSAAPPIGYSVTPCARAEEANNAMASAAPATALPRAERPMALQRNGVIVWRERL